MNDYLLQKSYINCQIKLILFISILVSFSTIIIPTFLFPSKLYQVSAQIQNLQKQEADKLIQKAMKQYENRQLDAALKSLEKALSLYKQIEDELGKTLVINHLKILALDYFSQSYQSSLIQNYKKVIYFSQKQLNIGKVIDDKMIQAQALGNLGSAYKAQENYIKAIDYIQQSLVIVRELQNNLDDPSRIGEKRALTNLISAYYSIGEYQQVIHYNQELVKLSQKLGDKYTEMFTITTIGHIYAEQGDYQNAIIQHQKALNISRQLKERHHEGFIHGSLAVSYFGLGNSTTAIQYLQKSLNIANNYKDIALKASSLMHLGLVYTYLKDYPQAITKLQKSLELIRVSKSPLGEGSVLHNLGYSLYRSGNLNAAEKTLRKAIQFWELERKNLGQNNAYKISIFERQTVTYQLLQKILVLQNRSTEALQIAERGRTQAFVELLRNRLENNKNIKSINIEKIKQIAKEQNATLVEYSIIYDNHERLFVHHGEKALEKNQPTELYIWVISPTGKVNFRQVDLKSFQQKENLNINHLVTKTRHSIGVKNRAIGVTPKPLEDMQQTKQLQALYKLLIEPIADILPKDSSEPVIFIPQGSLFLAPFPALQDSKGRYLIQKHTILTTPSIQVLDLTHQQRKRIEQSNVDYLKDILVVGNPQMPKVILEPGKPAQTLASLPGAEKEAKAIASLFKTEALIGKQATEAEVRQLIPQAKIIHLATHGFFDNIQGLDSAIAFSPNPLSEDEQGDGLFTAEEILNSYAPPSNSPLNASLVVLSACDTGRGRISGDGVIGLSRSLISGGVPSVIVSLWSVPDLPTAELMTKFYKNLTKQGMSKAQALRQAMLSTMKIHPSPRDWAGFTLIGEHK